MVIGKKSEHQLGQEKKSRQQGFICILKKKTQEGRESCLYLLFAYFCFSVQPILCRTTTWLRGTLTYFGYTWSPTLQCIIPSMVELYVSSHRCHVRSRKRNTAFELFLSLPSLSPRSSRVVLGIPCTLKFGYMSSKIWYSDEIAES